MRLSQPSRRLALVAASCLAPGWAWAQVVTSFIVINADTGLDIATVPARLTGGTVKVTVSTVQTPRINVRANVSGATSVVFSDASSSRSEGTAA